MINHEDFKTTSGQTRPTSEEVYVVRLKVIDILNSWRNTTEELFAAAKEFGLSLCPAEVGPQYLLQYPNQPSYTSCCVGMNPLKIGGDHLVFKLMSWSDYLSISVSIADRLTGWDYDDEFLFCVRRDS